MIIVWDDDTLYEESVMDWGGGAFVYVLPTFVIPLHALATSTLYHAEATSGESTAVIAFSNLVDEASNRIVDEAGNRLVVAIDEQAILLHARETDTLYHAEAT